MKSSLLLFFLLFLLTPLLVHAQTPSFSPRDQLKNRLQNSEVIITKKAEIKVTGQQSKALFCDRATEKINTRLTKYESLKDKWTTRHQGVIRRLESLSGKLEAKDCDASVIRSDIVLYQNLVNDFAAAFRDFHTSLQGTRAYICSEPTGEFKTQFKESQDKLNLVRHNAQKLQDFFTHTLKPHLTEINKSCP